MQVKELIKQLEKLDKDLDIYIPIEFELQEPIIQIIDLYYDKYYLLVTN